MTKKKILRVIGIVVLVFAILFGITSYLNWDTAEDDGKEGSDR